MMKFNLWDLIEVFGTKEERKFFSELSDKEYEKLDDKVEHLCKTIRNMIKGVKEK